MMGKQKLRLTQQSCRLHRGAGNMAGRHLNRLPPAKTKHRFTTDSPGLRGDAAVQCRPDAGIKYGIYFLQHIYIVKQPVGPIL